MALLAAPATANTAASSIMRCLGREESVQHPFSWSTPRCPQRTQRSVWTPTLMSMPMPTSMPLLVPMPMPLPMTVPAGVSPRAGTVMRQGRQVLGRPKRSVCKAIDDGRARPVLQQLRMDHTGFQSWVPTCGGEKALRTCPWAP